MTFSFLSSFKKSPPKIKHDPLLVDTFYALAKKRGFFTFKQTPIYHHNDRFTIPYFLFDSSRGIYLLEVKNWNLQTLQDAKIEKANEQQHTENTLAYEKTHQLLCKKFNEITHKDLVPIYNFLLLPHITYHEYQTLSQEKQSLLNEEKIFFKGYTQKDMIIKLQTIPPLDITKYPHQIVEHLFIQYTSINYKNKPFFASQEQRDFIDAPLHPFNNIQAPQKSGKTSLLLLKAIQIVLEKEQKVVIIKPTQLSKDLLQQQLLAIIEHAIIEFDFTRLEILTPEEFTRKHRQHLKLFQQKDKNSILDELIFNKPFFYAPFVLCDSSYLYEDGWYYYLQNTQKKAKLVLFNMPDSPITHQLTKSYLPKKSYTFIETNPYPKAIHLITQLLKEEAPQDIMVVCNKETKQQLFDDLQNFLHVTVAQLDGNDFLSNQSTDALLLATPYDTIDINVKHIVVIDLCFFDIKALENTFLSASNTITLLYNEMCTQITQLKELYGNNEDERAMEEGTLT